jgi:hypothetical protein
MLKASDPRIASHRNAEVREVLQEIDVIEQAVGKALSRPRVILPGPTHDLFKIS